MTLPNLFLLRLGLVISFLHVICVIYTVYTSQMCNNGHSLKLKDLTWPTTSLPQAYCDRERKIDINNLKYMAMFNIFSYMKPF